MWWYYSDYGKNISWFDIGCERLLQGVSLNKCILWHLKEEEEKEFLHPVIADKMQW